MKRGVMLPPIGTVKEKSGTSFSIIGDMPFLNSVPAAVLYWDKVFAPVAIRGMAPQYDVAVDRLVNLGIAESLDLKSENKFSGLDIQPMLSAYAASLAELDSRDSELWSIMPLMPGKKETLAYQSKPYLPKSHGTIASIEVHLRSALPVPDRDVPYEDLLEFKQKRSDQIQRLHSELSQVASRYIGLMDDEKGLGLALNDVEAAVLELQRVYEEKWAMKTVKNLTSAFALEGVLPAGITYLAGVPIDVAFLTGAGTAIVKSAVTANVPSKHQDNPYCYALDAANL